MKKDRFNQLLTDYAARTAVEALELVSLSEEFPYSQPLSTLAARAASDSLPERRQALIRRAALAAPDRAVLKEVILKARQPRSPERIAPPDIVSEPAITQTSAANLADPAISQPPDLRSGDQVRRELITDLHELSRLMKRFETQAVRVDMLSHKAVVPPSNNKKEPSSKAESVSKKAQVEKKPGDSLTKRTPEEKKRRKEEKKRKKDEKLASEPLLLEIKKTRKKLEPPGRKRKVQRELIDRFIKEQPSISKPVFTDAPGVDLSEASTSFSEQIISETLVEILIKQGKREKAIEVLKKLIWKIPQKKAYFAAQIEDLKRS